MTEQMIIDGPKAGDKVTMTLPRRRRWWQLWKPREWTEDVELTVEWVAHCPPWDRDVAIVDVPR